MLETETDSSGNYDLGNLPAGSYTLVFGPGNDSRYLGEWWENKSSQQSALFFAVSDGATVTKNAALTLGAVFSGTVRGDASPDIALGNVTVTAYTSSSTAVATTSTDSSGHYQLKGLPSGSYYLRFTAPSVGWGSEWYPGAASFAGAAPPVLFATLATSYTVDATLDTSIRLVGHVRDKNGAPLSGVTVILYDSNQTPNAVVQSYVTGAGGSYLFNSLPNDDYAIALVKKASGAITGAGPAASDDGYVTQWYDQSYSFASSVRYQGVPNGTLATLDFVLENPFFADVNDPSSPFYTAIEWMASSSISTGTAQGGGLDPLYNPTAMVSRQSMATFLYRLSGDSFTPPATPSFADVPSSASTFTAIEWMASEGISLGTANPGGLPLFNPSATVSRSAMALFLYRMSGASFVPPAEASFADVPTSASNFTAIEWMKANGISLGTAQPSGLPLFNPASGVSRQSMALFLYRYAT